MSGGRQLFALRRHCPLLLALALGSSKKGSSSKFQSEEEALREAFAQLSIKEDDEDDLDIVAVMTGAIQQVHTVQFLLACSCSKNLR